MKKRFVICGIFIIVLISLSSCNGFNSSSSEIPDYELIDSSEDVDLHIEKDNTK